MLDNDHLRNLLYLKYTNTSDIVDRILSRNWETDHECLMELNAIKTGFDNREEWAMRGKFDLKLVFYLMETHSFKRNFI